MHVSLIFAILLCIADTNKGHKGRENGLHRLQQYISAFETLSTIILVRHIRRGLVFERSTLLWNEAKDLAISQLRSSSAGGPKMLKIVIFKGSGDKSGLEWAVEDVVV